MYKISRYLAWEIRIANPPKIADIRYRINTAFGVDNPLLTNWWWICNKSGLKIFFFKIIRLKTLRIKSIKGNAKIKLNIIKDIVDFITPTTEMTANKYPSSKDPESPRNILAG